MKSAQRAASGRFVSKPPPKVRTRDDGLEDGSKYEAPKIRPNTIADVIPGSTLSALMRLKHQLAQKERN